jgi:deoxyguanosine kinase
MTYIVIEGVIGVGKTSLATMLAKDLHCPTVLEDMESDRVNTFLSNFYANREQYAFQTEVFFLLNRYRQQQAVVKPALTHADLVGDYLFAKTRLFAGLNLRDAELDLFNQIYEALANQVATPTLVVYLSASVNTLMARIYQRDRAFERTMDRAYIADLARLYDSFFDTYQDAPILKIDTNNLDFVRDQSDHQKVAAQILAAAGLSNPGQPESPAI